MRNFKIFLWIFVIFLVQTVVLSPIHIFGAVPSAVLAFVMCVAILENEFRTAVIISGICAVVMGAIGGRNFTEITLFYAYSSIIVFAARKRPRYVGNFPKTIVWTFIMSAILEILLFVIREMTLDVSVIFSDALPTAVFNTVIAVILYPILKKTLYKEEKKIYDYNEVILNKEEAYNEALNRSIDVINKKLSSDEYIISKKVLKKEVKRSKINLEVFFKVYEKIGVTSEIQDIGEENGEYN